MLSKKNEVFSFLRKHRNKAILLPISLLLLSCNFNFPVRKEEKRAISYPLVFSIGEQPTFEPKKLAKEIKNTLIVWQDNQSLSRYDSVRYFFENRNYLHRWLSVSDTSSYKNYINIIHSAKKNGLLPNAYHYEQIQTNIDNLLFFFRKRNIIDYTLWAETEILLSDAFLTYAEHLSNGVIEPLQLEDYNYNIEQHKPSRTYILKTADIVSAFEQLTPKHPQYVALSTIMNSYPDDLENDTINKIRVNMERWRWYNNKETKHIYINIPEYKLYLKENDSNLVVSNIVVGVKKSKEYKHAYQRYLNHPTTKRPYPNETPELISSVSYIVLNPSWHIPKNIVAKEIFHHVVKDVSYLDKHGYVVYNGGKIIDPYKVNWKNYSPEYLPFFFVQPPSDSNALGKMKIIFPNKFSVYLHDTRSRQDFNKSMRALSHGCIRVEKYLDVAEKILNIKKYNKKYFLEKMQDKNKTTNLFLRERCGVWIDYKTAVVDDGKLLLFNDIYDKDIVILNKMKSTVKLNNF